MVSDIAQPIVFAFLGMILVAFIIIIFCDDYEDKTLQKIIGGLAVFIIALAANKTSIYFLSIFIGGLIIASENFMMFLAAVMKTDSTRIAETVTALNTTKASKEEMFDKIQREQEEIKIERAVVVPEPYKSTSESSIERLEKIKKIEGLVHSYLKKRFSDKYQIQMKLSNSMGEAIVDGIILNTRNEVGKIVEIKFITEKSYNALRFILSNFVRKLKALNIKKRLLVIIVSEELTLEQSEKMKQETETLATTLFFQFKNDSILPVLIPEKYK